MIEGVTLSGSQAMFSSGLSNHVANCLSADFTLFWAIKPKIEASTSIHGLDSSRVFEISNDTLRFAFINFFHGTPIRPAIILKEIVAKTRILADNSSQNQEI
jgi:hypothetical protein